MPFFSTVRCKKLDDTAKNEINRCILYLNQPSKTDGLKRKL